MSAASTPRPSTPHLDLEDLAALGTENLERIIAIDSQSDERSTTIPSTEGQRRLARLLADTFAALGFAAELDRQHNLLVSIPAAPGSERVPPLALMVHLDTARGTEAVPSLERLGGWDGSRVPYPHNERLEVSVARYPEMAPFVGEDLLFGPGRFPVGLDDKLGAAEVMTLAQVLAREPSIPHGPLILVFRPDEEIGRMEAVASLAEVLADRGVRYGYTVDGIAPFEIQVENFEASRAVVTLRGRRRAPPTGSRLAVRVHGCKSHGATAKAEGYLNATVIVARALTGLAAEVASVCSFESDPRSEVDADVVLCVRSPEARTEVLRRLREQAIPHRWRGAEIVEREVPDGADEVTDAADRAIRLIEAFLRSEGPTPLLSEDSEGRQGYSNPYFVRREGDGAVIDFRLRAFERAELTAREEHVRALAAAASTPDAPVEVEIIQQYVNMGPALRPYPELTRWAEEAARAVGAEPRVVPIRGGTGVDPFLARGIPIANLGTGYFAPESEKEVTSRQKIAQHARWLVELVGVIASSSST